MSHAISRRTRTTSAVLRRSRRNGSSPSVRRRPIAWIVSAGIGVALTSGSCTRHREIVIPSGYVYHPTDWAVAWSSPIGPIVVIHGSRWVRGDAARRLCTRSGVYVATTDSVSPIRAGWPPDVCLLDLYRGKVQGKPDGTEAILSSEGRLFRWFFSSGVVQSVPLPPHLSSRFPSWDQKGIRIAFVGMDRGAGSSHQEGLYTALPDGSDVTRVLDLNGLHVVSPPSWSPDGGSIVFSARGDSSASSSPIAADLMVVDLGTKVSRRIGRGSYPAWSPTGDWIAFFVNSRDGEEKAASDSTTYEGGAGTIRFVRPNGADNHGFLPTTATNIPFALLDAMPPLVWSPNGNRFAFTRQAGDGDAVWFGDSRSLGVERLESLRGGEER